MRFNNPGRNGIHDPNSPTASQRLTRRAGKGESLCSFEQLEERVLMSITGFAPTSLPFVRGSEAGAAVFAAPVVASPLGGGFSNSGGQSLGTFDGTSNNGQAVTRVMDFYADPRFSSITGSGFSSVVIDTGLNASHPFFGPDLDNNGVADRVRYVYNFAGSGGTGDLNGHGSNVAGAIASNDPSAPGMAPDAGIIGLRVFDSAGMASMSSVEQALRWVINNQATYNIVSVNMSLGDGMRYSSPTTNPMISDELATLANLGVIVVAAAGNSFYDFNSQQGLSYPAADPNVISVGAVYGNTGSAFTYADGAQGTSIAGAITPFTQRAPWLDIMAPGAPITGPAASGTGTVTMHGTSQASPIVAGAAVLVQQLAMNLLGRRLNLDEFRQLIQSNSGTVWDGAGGPAGDPAETDNVNNTNASYRLLDMFALGEAMYAMAGIVELSPALPNNAPVLSSGGSISGGIEGRSMVLSYGQLRGAVAASDADGQSLGIVIRSVQDGRLTINGRTAMPGAVVNADDTVVWTPGASGTGLRDAFTVAVTDGIETSAASGAIRIDLAQARTSRVYEPGVGDETPNVTPLAGLEVMPGGIDAMSTMAAEESGVSDSTPVRLSFIEAFASSDRSSTDPVAANQANTESAPGVLGRIGFAGAIMGGVRIAA